MSLYILFLLVIAFSVVRRSIISDCKTRAQLVIELDIPCHYFLEVSLLSTPFYSKVDYQFFFYPAVQNLFHGIVGFPALTLNGLHSFSLLVRYMLSRHIRTFGQCAAQPVQMSLSIKIWHHWVRLYTALLHLVFQQPCRSILPLWRHQSKRYIYHTLKAVISDTIT